MVIDSLRHHRSRRNADGNATFCKSINCTEKINHKYYTSETFPNGQKFWRDIESNPSTKTQTILSNSFLRRHPLKLSFKFPYYGHYLDSVVLTTGGFLYMDGYKTKLITDVQYLAPLMAYFSPNHHPDSKVLTLDNGSQLTVQWSNVYLVNRTDVGNFTFQCTLHKNGTIWFAYKQIPVNVSTLPDIDKPKHPVRVGISDAYVRLFRHPWRPVYYRIFFVYSQVNISKNSVVSGAAVVFHPLPSCVTAKSCAECMERKNTTEFNCQWCPKTKRCSDLADRHRSEWEIANCRFNPVKEISDVRCLPGRKTSTTTTTTTTALYRQNEKQKGRSKGGVSAGTIVGICIVLILVIGIAAWCAYAYRHPTSKSGLFLIDATRRPRELFKRISDGGGKTGAVAASDIKPQVL